LAEPELARVGTLGRRLVRKLVAGAVTAVEAALMTIELTKQDREQAILSIQRYFQENLDTHLGNVAAGGLLSFFTDEVGPSIYNKGVRDAQERIQACAAELDFEVHEEEFSYWRKCDKLRRSKP